MRVVQTLPGLLVPRILCIDDNKDVLESLQGVLHSAGYKTLTALSGKQGLEILLRASVDLIVLDYEMPEMDGYLVAQAIRKCSPGTPVVVFTGFPDGLPGALRQIVSGVVSKADCRGLLNLVATPTQKA